MHKKVLTGIISVAMIAILAGCGSAAVSATQEVHKGNRRTWRTLPAIKEIQAMLDKGSNINFVTWTAGKVMEEVSSNISSEHMASFDYGYKLSSVRDWIFAKKNDKFVSLYT